MVRHVVCVTAMVEVLADGMEPDRDTVILAADTAARGISDTAAAGKISAKVLFRDRRIVGTKEEEVRGCLDVVQKKGGKRDGQEGR